MKIFILEQSFMSSAKNIAEILSNKLINFNNISKFVSTKNSNVYEFISNDDLVLALKNNVMLFVENDQNDEFIGITLDEYYASNILPLKISQFNNIIDEYVNDNLIIWLDNKTNKDSVKKDLSETNYLVERIESLNLKYLYFFNESDEDIIKVIKEYIEGTDEDRIKIENEYR